MIERPIALGGVPFLLVDTAGLRGEGADEIEQLGIMRAEGELGRADIILWLGPEGEGPAEALEVASMSDLEDATRKGDGAFHVSSTTRDGLADLIAHLVALGRERLPKPGQVAVSRRQKERLADARESIRRAAIEDDLLISGEALRQARHAMDAMLGTVATEDMLDALFGRFCIGK